MVEGASGVMTIGRRHRAIDALREGLSSPFDFSPERESEPVCYHMQTQFIHLDFGGKRTAVETYVLRLKCPRAGSPGKPQDGFVCSEFGVQREGPTLAILPTLRGFAYRFDQLSGVLRKGPFFGIPQEPFAGLRDSLGRSLPPDICYAAYNNFVDFHALSDVFTRPMPYVKGIEQLKSLGDRIVLPGAFSEAPVSLAGVVREGSTFRNGELTLELKGVGLVDE
ncbi:MAG TPA: hypothetical protein VGS23_08585, partial [Thermoplasmata archaeon]|nr:hypothetical protein [Thermoplasmata archaeon]